MIDLQLVKLILMLPPLQSLVDKGFFKGFNDGDAAVLTAWDPMVSEIKTPLLFYSTV